MAVIIGVVPAGAPVKLEANMPTARPAELLRVAVLPEIESTLTFTLPGQAIELDTFPV
jgi:hypothetical protein